MVATEQVAAQARPRYALPTLVTVTTLVILAVVVGWPETLVDSLGARARDIAGRPLAMTWIVGLPALLVAERVFAIDRPDYRDPRVLMNVLYSLALSPAMVTIVGFFVFRSHDWVAENMNLFHLDVFDGLPAWSVGVLAFLIGDFLLWLTHMITHKVPAFWRFHEVHHSPTTMTMFVADRSHPLEAVFQAVFSLGIIVALGPTIQRLQWLAIIASFGTWWVYLVHANVRLRLGPLRHVLVTPQSHRIHHSAREDHWDSNYGFVLSIWDRAFGTQNADSTSYPPTGIDQERFPFPESLAPKEMASAFAAQVAWPFRKG
ncbi:MAG: sterol desaturase family protein [Actinomycetota bacterium]